MSNRGSPPISCSCPPFMSEESENPPIAPLPAPIKLASRSDDDASDDAGPRSSGTDRGCMRSAGNAEGGAGAALLASWTSSSAAACCKGVRRFFRGGFSSVPGAKRTEDEGEPRMLAAGDAEMPTNVASLGVKDCRAALAALCIVGLGPRRTVPVRKGSSFAGGCGDEEAAVVERLSPVNGYGFADGGRGDSSRSVKVGIGEISEFAAGTGLEVKRKLTYCGVRAIRLPCAIFAVEEEDDQKAHDRQRQDRSFDDDGRHRARRQVRR